MVSLAAMITGCNSSAAPSSPLPPQQRLRVATTTSLYDTGLWGYLKPIFEEKYNVELAIIYAGTGKALEYGRRGDVDIITVHSKAREEQFIAEGYGVRRVPFAYNYFLIVGPEADPTDIKGLNPEEAFKKLIREGTGNPKQVKFVSRGDESGTHSKEKEIWRAAGFNYESIQESSWARSKNGGYLESGTGMGQILMIASTKEAYTLTDMGTYLAYRSKLDLVPMIDKGDILLNVYSAIAINPYKLPETKIDMANNLIEFLVSPEIQELIGNYGIKEYKMQLFTPYAGAEPK
ncbi:substrate-binding domain-containing protein [Chloroflexota bacterium]